MSTTLIARMVAASCRRPWLVVAVAVFLGVGAVSFTIRHFALTADTAQLISPKLAWRRTSAEFDRAFPQNMDLTAVIIDGATPELAESAATRLRAALTARPDMFKTVRRPNSGPYFQANGLMLLPLADVQRTMNQLIAAQPFLGPLAADPSLRGLMSVLSTLMIGVQQGQAKLSDMDAPISTLDAALGRVVRGQPAFFSWSALFAGGSGGHRQLRQFVLVQPKLDFGALEPGAASSDLIRKTARSLQLDAAHGVRVRLTGSVPLADDQFGSLLDRVWLISGAMLASMLLMLWLAVRSLRIMVCILATTFLGLVITAGAGLLLVGRFNLISVAFIPLFVGLGVDFGIQFSVRYKAERLSHSDLKSALIAAGKRVGGSLALAASAIAVGFFTFIPTSYTGVSELGIIAGLGMGIAFLLAVTLLPAMLVLIRPRGETREVGFSALAPLDVLLVERRRLVLQIFAGAAVVCLLLLPFLRFDFNPLHMENPHSEAMATLADMSRDPDETPNTIDVLSPSLSAADSLAHRLSSLPEVAQALTLSSFVPDQQTDKLAVISDAAGLIGPTLTPMATAPAPSDAETVASLRRTAQDLVRSAGSVAGPAADHARSLAHTLEQLAQSPPDVRTKATATVIAPLAPLFDQIRRLLQAGPVTAADLPRSLVSDWTSSRGQARIQVFPKGDSNDNAVLVRFSRAVLRVAPNATGAPITIQEAGKTIEGAFVQAFVLSFLATIVLLWVVLRRMRDVVLTMIPILLTALLTLATCVIVGQPLNFANIIAFPLLFGIGVAFNIYFVLAWRAGETNLLQSSLTRAVLFSALTTGSSFGSIWLSQHPGTASMGKVLLISLSWILVTALLFEPALLGPPPDRTSTPKA